MTTTRSRAPSLLAIVGLQAALAAVISLITARWLGPSDRGVIVVVVTGGSLLMLVGSLGTATGSRLLLSQDDPRFSLGRQARLSLIMIAWQLPLAAFVGWPLILLSGAWRGWTAGLIFVLYAAALLGAFLSREALHGIGLHRSAVAGDLLAAGVQVAGVCVLRASDAITVTSVLAVMAAAVWGEVFALRVLLRHRRHSRARRIDTIALRQLVVLSLPALTSTVGQAFVIRGDRLLLGAYHGTGPVGIYGVGATFSELVWLGATALSQICFRSAAEGQWHRVRQIRLANLVLTVVSAVVVAALAAPAVRILLGDAFAASVPIVWILLIAAVLMSAYLIESAVHNGSGRMTVPAQASVLGSIILSVACLLLIPKLGAYGAAIGTCIAYTAMIVVVSVQTKRGVRPKVNVAE